MTPSGDTPSLSPVPSAREDNAHPYRAWWKWWPLVAFGVSVYAWFAYGVDVLYAIVVASVAVYALVEALERGRSTLRAAVEPVAWSAGAWLAGIAFGALTGWGTADRVTLGAWGLAVGATIVALVLILKRTVLRSR